MTASGTPSPNGPGRFARLRQAWNRVASGSELAATHDDPSELMVLPGPLPNGWDVLDVARGRFLDNEIARETSKGHSLYSVPFRSLAGAVGSDDVIIELSGGEYGIVHPAYQVETDPRWPDFVSFTTCEALIEEAGCMATGWDTSTEKASGESEAGNT